MGRVKGRIVGTTNLISMFDREENYQVQVFK